MDSPHLGRYRFIPSYDLTGRSIYIINGSPLITRSSSYLYQRVHRISPTQWIQRYKSSHDKLFHPHHSHLHYHHHHHPPHYNIIITTTIVSLSAPPSLSLPSSPHSLYQGFPIFESSAAARHLISSGIPPSDVLEESMSLDTVGNVRAMTDYLTLTVVRSIYIYLPQRLLLLQRSHHHSICHICHHHTYSTMYHLYLQ